MKVAIIKPDWRISGGFEKVLGHVERDLIGAGHDIRRIEVDVPSVARRPFGVDIESGTWDRAPEWFTHLALLERFRNLDVSWADLVVSTQPPSYAVRHPRHLALFYHHARAFYDLEKVWIDAGFAPETLHTTASALLRQAEADDFDGVTHFLAGSERVEQRLRHFQGPDVPLSLYHAAGPPIDDETEGRFEHALCVSRQEFTKRTEMAVLGISLANEVTGVLVGGGGRLPFVRALAAGLAAGTDPESLSDEDIWLNAGLTEQQSSAAHPRVDIRGRVDDRVLTGLYRDALCVIAPAYDEDDGLTVVEAMSHGKPVIVCRDGGGLTALVRDGVNGFVVEPTARGIANALQSFAEDTELARRMGIAARDTARQRTPEQARTRLLAAVEKVFAN